MLDIGNFLFPFFSTFSLVGAPLVVERGGFFFFPISRCQLTKTQGGRVYHSEANSEENYRLETEPILSLFRLHALYNKNGETLLAKLALVQDLCSRHQRFRYLENLPISD